MKVLFLALLMVGCASTPKAVVEQKPVIRERPKAPKVIATKPIEKPVDLNNFMTEISYQAHLRAKPELFADSIGKLPKGTKVEVLGWYGNFYHVKSAEAEGWTSEAIVVLTEAIKRKKPEWKKAAREQKKAKIKEQIEAQEQEREQQRAEARRKWREALAAKRKTLTEAYGAKIAERLMNGQIWIGMTRAMAIAARGEPEDINKTTTAGGVSEQFVYGDMSNRKYLYFDNGILTTIQE